MPFILVPSSAKRIATQILVVAKLNGRKDLVLRGCVYVGTHLGFSEARGPNFR